MYIYVYIYIYIYIFTYSVSEQRLNIGSTICRNLMEKVSRDMRGIVTSYIPKKTAVDSSGNIQKSALHSKK